jgi:hypothetical protein
VRRIVLAFLGFTLASCPRPAVVAPPTGSPTASPSATLWSYEVNATSLDDLTIDATFTAGTDDAIGIDQDFRSFVHDVVVVSSNGTSAATPTKPPQEAWSVGCRARGCHVRYGLRLRAMAQKIASADVAITTGDAVIATPSVWMLRPLTGSDDGRVRFHVSGAPFTTGIDAVNGGAENTHELRVDDLDGASFTVFGPVRVESVAVGASSVDVGVLPGTHALDPVAVARWIGSDARAVADYYRGYPVPHVLVLVMPVEQDVTRGVTLGDGGPALLVRIGKPISEATLADDWVVTHEMLHVAFPSLAREHAWLNEGLASYIEPLVRARAGMIDDVRVWQDLVDGLPQGNPEPGDEGLEKTHTWGRTYWGGALFCLVADVTIRERTKNTRSLDDAMRAIAQKGGTVRAHWSIEAVLDEADAATGTHVLHELYQTMALAPGKVDLPALYAKLGVSLTGGKVKLDDAAPLAAIRRSMTAKK